MTIETLLPVVLFALVATVSPGGATTLATASGAHFGFGRSIPLVMGISAALSSMAAGAAFGLGGLLLAAPPLQLAMKSAGLLYLLWLAVKIGASNAPRLNREIAAPTGFLGGAWMLWYNPKAWAMTTSAAASFAATTHSSVALAVFLGSAFGIAAMLSLSLWCMAGQWLGRALKTDWQWRTINFILAGLLVISVIPMWK
ncbi:LysE family translocator [Rhizobium tubonense]|uniref:Amino acid transporter n=1 Tax=Rhizobium tubonense TaxID=484088 RepID=A0A2W4E5I1_9HYPH|nr:LysE family transporter [Rhizobium tubonense]PZM10756.1 amino acid transporter [Rhizobium tubonense]